MPEGVLTRLMRLAFWPLLVAITAAALLPQGPPMPFEVSDVVLHAGAFATLTAVLGRAYYEPGRWRWPVRWMVLYGLALELVQSFIPDRSAEVKDLIVDAVGIAAGVALWCYAIPHLERWMSAWTPGRE